MATFVTSRNHCCSLVLDIGVLLFASDFFPMISTPVIGEHGVYPQLFVLTALSGYFYDFGNFTGTVRFGCEKRKE